MISHEHFDLFMHTDAELEAILGAPIKARQTLRAWPLSVVSRIDLEDGRALIYKAIKNLPTEVDFYRAVQSRHIPNVYYRESQRDAHWLILEWVEGQHPERLDRAQLLALAASVQAIIAPMPLRQPYRLDLSGRGCSHFIDSTLALLRKLGAAGKLQATDGAAISRIENQLHHPSVAEAAQLPCSTLHGDMKCDNIITKPDGELAIIDWQNVLRGPTVVDTYSLLATQGLDPVPIAGIGPELMRLALEMRWFAECLNAWMPDAKCLDGAILNIERHMQHLVDRGGYAGMDVYYFH